MLCIVLSGETLLPFFFASLRLLNRSKKATHLVCSKWNEQKCAEAKKDRKVVVTPQWIYDCETEGERLEEDEYLLKEESSSRSRTSSRSRRSRSPRKVNYAEDSDSVDDVSEGSVAGEASEDEDWGISSKSKEEKEEESLPSKRKPNKPSKVASKNSDTDDFVMKDEDVEMDDFIEDIDSSEEIQAPTAVARIPDAKEKKKPLPTPRKRDSQRVEMETEDSGDSEATEEMDLETIGAAAPITVEEGLVDFDDDAQVVVRGPGKQGWTQFNILCFFSLDHCRSFNSTS